MAYTVPKLTDYSPAAMEKAAGECIAACGVEAAGVRSDADLKSFRDYWMARKSGILTQINDLWLKEAPKGDKKIAGFWVNALKARVTEIVEHTRESLASEQFAGTLTPDSDAPPLHFSQGTPGLATQFGGTAVEAPVLPSPERQATLELMQSLSAKRQPVIDLARSIMEASAAFGGPTLTPEEALGMAEPVDISLPGIRRPIGAEHPVIKTRNEIVGVFERLGYSVAEGPVVETDYYNFEALNFPPNHPARDTQDTLFIAGQHSKPQRERLLLRTHTSPVQIRTMEKMRPPIRIVIPGTVHRNDPPDASHSPMFHQIEGLAVDTNITFGDLKGTLDHAMKALFGSNVKTHFRPSFFPFTEPSAELYVTCFICGGSGKRGLDDAPCRPCKQTGWIEVLGCGMVDPNVFEFVKDNGYNPKKVSGFAFGMGVDRLALLKYGVDDIQLFFQGDVRFLEQFG
ncbi:MAG: phenylalanine--tRNA ligase subunit alpha [Candidatus Sulfotelmatobacter sp.]